MKIKKDIAETEKRIGVLENNVTEWVEDIRKEVQTLSEKVEEDRQYSRFNSAILHGFKNCNLHLNDIDFIFYIANELNRLFPSLNGKILPAHIDEAHPLSKKKGGTKLVLIKFVNRWVKRSLLACEADLIGTGISISEHLTGFSQKLVSSAKALVGDDKVWVYKNTVFAQSGEKEFKIRNTTDLNKLRPVIPNSASDVITVSTSNSTTESSLPPSIIDSTTIPTAATFPNTVPLGNKNNLQGRRPQPRSVSITRPLGRPSRNGRGGLRHYNNYTPRHHNTYNPHWKNSRYDINYGYY